MTESARAALGSGDDDALMERVRALRQSASSKSQMQGLVAVLERSETTKTAVLAAALHTTSTAAKHSSALASTSSAVEPRLPNLANRRSLC